MWLQKLFSSPYCKVGIKQRLFVKQVQPKRPLFGMGCGSYGLSTTTVVMKNFSFQQENGQVKTTQWPCGYSRPLTVSYHSLRAWALRTSRFQCVKAVDRHTSYQTRLWTLAKASTLALTLSNTTAHTQSMVLVMDGEGTLVTSNSQDSFVRNYNDGVGQGSASQVMQLFGQQAVNEAIGATSDSFRVASVAPRGVAPRPEILQAIDATAMRYASHPALRRAGLTVTEWRLLFRSNIETESGYNINARSPVGAIGLGQLMPETARDLNVDPHDWQQNLDGSARYLLMMLVQFGNAQHALAAYNAGPNAVEQYAGIPPYRETQNHVSRVLAVFNRLEGENL